MQRALDRAGLKFGGHEASPRALGDYPFHEDEAVSKVFWDVRKGLIPIVGAAREVGTSMLIEDVACPVDKLADMTVDLVRVVSSRPPLACCSLGASSPRARKRGSHALIL